MDHQDELLLQGISVHYLSTTLLEEIEDSPLVAKKYCNWNNCFCSNSSSNINNVKVYDLEPDLTSDSHGFIRKKGANLMCPRDGKKGAAFVDSIQEEGAVGRATIMLSYCWGYHVKDIVQSLKDQCEKEKLDIKTTYIWICCFCNNQHRISKDIPFEDFKETFYGKVKGTGTVWSMMTPWNDPGYLKRVWCVFEVFTASKEPNVNSTIIMPKKEKDAMIESLNDIETLIKVLESTKIEKAEASKEVDRENILKLVKKEYGGFSELNNRVNDLMREWLLSALRDEREVACNDEIIQQSNDLDLASKCIDIGRAFYQQFGNLDEALDICNKALVIYEKNLGSDHPDTATSYNNIGFVMSKKGDKEGALNMYNKALVIYEKNLGSDHPDTALCYHNVGQLMSAKGDYEGALNMNNKALAIWEKNLGSDHPNTATCYSNIGLVMSKKGDYEGALNMYNKALAIEEKNRRSDHPETASCYHNVGSVMSKKGDYEGALNMLNKALAIREKNLGSDHPHTIKTKYHINRVCNTMIRES